MPNYRVIAEFVDLEAGQRRFPGETVEMASAARAKKLIDKGVIDPEPVAEARKIEAAAEEPEAPKETEEEPVAEKGTGKGKSKAK